MSPSSTITKVAVAGATGALGSVLTEELLKAGFELTALTRDASKAKLPKGVRAVTVDYESLDSLKSALDGQDAIVSTLGAQGVEQQQLLVDAALATGIKRFIPSEFGSDHSTAEARALPVYKPKVAIEEYLQRKCSGTATSYTIVTNNAFLDWGIENSFLIDVKEKKANIFDGGDLPLTLTPLFMVGQAVAGVLKRPEETANREVKLHGTTLTINQLVSLVQEYSTMEGWELTPWDTVEKNKQAYAALKSDPSNFFAWGLPMIFRAATGKGLLIDFADKNDNALLGIKTLTDEELRHIVKSSVENATHSTDTL